MIDNMSEYDHEQANYPTPQTYREITYHPSVLRYDADRGTDTRAPVQEDRG